MAFTDTGGCIYQDPSQVFSDRRMFSNGLLASLPEEAKEAALYSCRSRELAAGEVLRSPGDGTSHVYFIHRGLVSLLAKQGGTGGVEVASVGSEGMVGLSAVFGPNAGSLAAVAFSESVVAELDVAAFHEICRRHPELHAAVLRYGAHRMRQVMRRSACAARHTLQKRLARWILESTGKLEIDQLNVTHATIAGLMGVRRASVTETLHRLEGDGAIRSDRGRLRIRNLSRLREASCGCESIDASDFLNSH